MDGVRPMIKKEREKGKKIKQYVVSTDLSSTKSIPSMQMHRVNREKLSDTRCICVKIKTNLYYKPVRNHDLNL